MKKILALFILAAFLGCKSEPPMGPDPLKPGFGFGPPQDWVTGGGRIVVGTAIDTLGIIDTLTANFGFVAGLKSDTPYGHLTYVDQNADLHLHSIDITAYTVIDSVTREFAGIARLTPPDSIRTEVNFTATVADLGEPGRDDTFAIVITFPDQRTYSASGTLIGGNIQLHERKLRITPGLPGTPAGRREKLPQ
jgi:hypothetical protein